LSSNQQIQNNKYKHIAIKPETYNLLLSEARYSDSMGSVISRVFLAHTKQKQEDADNQLDMPTYTSTSPSNSTELLELDYQLSRELLLKIFRETGRGMEEFTVPAGTDPWRVICNRCTDRMEQKQSLESGNYKIPYWKAVPKERNDS
jgi:hypothetical protein